MSVNPLAHISPTAEITSGPADRDQTNSTHSPTPHKAPPSTGNPPNRVEHSPSTRSTSSASDEDAVQVQRENGNQIVIKYLDRSGSVVFQIPTSQVIALEKAIEQAFEKQTHDRETDTVAPVKVKGAANEH